MNVSGVLVTRAATLGRLRPIHGELWLVDTGLLYRSLDLRTTYRQTTKSRKERLVPQTVDPSDRPHRRFASSDLDAIAAEHPANRWVARSDLRGAGLRRGAATTTLRLRLSSGAGARLAWPRREQATQVVEEQLRDWLGDALESG